MARLYSNENFPFAVVKFLRSFGHDVLTSKEAGRADQGIPDEDVLLFSIQEKRILVTINRKDFIRLHRLNPIHFGIIVCTENRNWEEFAIKIHITLDSINNIDNQLIRVIRGS